MIGIGNELRGDDAAGLMVARAVGGHELAGDPVGLLELWEDASHVVLVDATKSGVPAGTIHRIDGAREQLPYGHRLEGHTGGIAEAVALARALGRMPTELLVIGIEGESFELGAGLSEAVSEAIASVVRELSPHGQGAGAIPSRSANATGSPVAKDSPPR